MIIALAISGCGEDTKGVIEDSINDVTNITDGPDTNKQDFLVQDLNIVDVGKLDKDELAQFDVSGPEYSGITSIGGSSSSSLTEGNSTETVADNNSGKVVAITQYHIYDSSKNGIKDIKASDLYNIQIKPYSYDEYLKSAFEGYQISSATGMTFESTDFFKTKYGTVDNLPNDTNTIFYDMAKWATGSSTDTQVNQIRAFLVQSRRDKYTASSLGSDLIQCEKAFHVIKSSKADNYSRETEIAVNLYNKLKSADYKALKTPTDWNRAMTIPAMSNYVYSSGANLNVVIVYGEIPVQYKSLYEVDNGGYLFIMSDSDQEQLTPIVSDFKTDYEKSSNPLSIMSYEVAHGSTSIAAQQSGILVSADGFWNVKDNSARCTLLNYEQVPTLIFCVNFTGNSKSDSVIANQISNSLFTAIENYLKK